MNAVVQIVLDVAGIIALVAAVIWGACFLGDLIGDAIQKRRDFRGRVSWVEFRVKAHSAQLDLARQVMEIMAKKILEQGARIETLEQEMKLEAASTSLLGNDIRSLKRAQGEDSITLHDLEGQHENLAGHVADQLYQLSGRVTALEIKRTRKVA